MNHSFANWWTNLFLWMLQQLYIMDDQECSELCSCGAETLALSCHALCVPLVPCRTSLAYYSHAAPAYQAFRGRCLCYSGRFICMRPPPGEYKVKLSFKLSFRLFFNGRTQKNHCFISPCFRNPIAARRNFPAAWLQVSWTFGVFHSRELWITEQFS